MEGSFYVYSVHEKMADGKAAYDQICGVKFDGLLIMVRRLAHGGLRSWRIAKTVRELVSFRSTKKSHKKEICWVQVQTNLSDSSIFVNRHAAKS